MRTGFVGLGDQGGPMAQAILSAGLDLSVWARRSSVREEWAAQGAHVAAGPAELARNIDLLCVCVTADADVTALLEEEGMLAAMPSDAVVAIHSTIRPATCLKLAAVARMRGLTLLDAPVSGSGHAALTRTLLVMVGGDRTALLRIMPVLDCHAGQVVEMGAVGAAMSAKLINNLMAAVNIGHAYDALVLGAAAGLNVRALRGAIMAGTGRTFAMDLLERLHAPGKAAHVAAVLRKDVTLALEELPQAESWRAPALAGLSALERLARGETVLTESERESGR